MDSERTSLHKARALKVYAMPPRHAAKSPPNVLAYMLPSFAIHSCLMTKLQVKWSVVVSNFQGLRQFHAGYFPDTEEVTSSNLVTPTINDEAGSKCFRPLLLSEVMASMLQFKLRQVCFG